MGWKKLREKKLSRKEGEEDIGWRLFVQTIPTSASRQSVREDYSFVYEKKREKKLENSGVCEN